MKNKLRDVHVRLFERDVITLRRIAEERGSFWHVELRQLVRRALASERREIVVLSEQA